MAKAPFDNIVSEPTEELIATARRLLLRIHSMPDLADRAELALLLLGPDDGFKSATAIPIGTLENRARLSQALNAMAAELRKLT